MTPVRASASHAHPHQPARRAGPAPDQAPTWPPTPAS